LLTCLRLYCRDRDPAGAVFLPEMWASRTFAYAQLAADVFNLLSVPVFMAFTMRPDQWVFFCLPTSELLACVCLVARVSARAFPLGSPLPHLRRDWAHPCRICAGTGLTPAAPAPGPSVPVFTAVPASRCFPVLLVPPTVSRSLLQMVACAYASDVISLISILYHSRRAYRRNGVIQMNPKVIRHGYGDCALHSTRNCQQLLH
jgi:hypothetical protein